MKRWSTKDLQILRSPSEGQPGDGILTFTDRYSVYDFGVMPNRIPGKGVASCAMAVASFGLLRDAGVTTHFVDQVADDALRIKLLDVDLIGRFSMTGSGSLIPLQVIYRNALPKESSVHRRLSVGELAPELVPPQSESRPPWLEDVMVEFTTKFEEVDRFVSRQEAASVGRVSFDDLETIVRHTRQVNEVLSAHSARVGLELLDGKVEYGFDAERNLMLVDHAGTPDENRFYRDGLPACKELLRLLHPDLRRIVQQAVRNKIPRDQWPRPHPLAPELVAAVSDVYQALAAVWIDGSVDTAHRLSAVLRTFLDAAPVAVELAAGTSL